MNASLIKKMSGLQGMLMGGHKAGAGSSTNSRGKDRELFISGLLERCLPLTHRFGSGEVTSPDGTTSGQLDIIVEHPFAPSFTPIDNGSRFCLQESVAAAIEVKSNVMNQWSEVEATSKQLRKLTRGDGFARAGMGGAKMDLALGPIPLFAVGYEGWKTADPGIEKVKAGTVDAVLTVESQILVVGKRFADPGHEFGTVVGPASLWALICLINDCMRAIAARSINYFAYVV